MNAKTVCAARLALAISGSLTGCSTVSPDPRREGSGTKEGPLTASAPANPQAPTTKRDSVPGRLISYQLKPVARDTTTPGTGLYSAGLRLAEDEVVNTPDSAAPRAARQERLLSFDYLKRIGSDVKSVFTAPARWETQDYLVLSGVAAGIVVVGVFDEEIQRAVQRGRNSTVDSVFKAVEPFGAEYSFAVLGGFYLGGELFHDPRAKSVALDGLSASAITFALIDLPLKYSIGRSRPNHNHGAYEFSPFSGRESFPSGHATQAFAVATVVAEHYDSIWIKAGAYGVASMVGYGRMNRNVHWATDVLAGAAIGTFVGHVVVHANQHWQNLTLTPLLSPDYQGAQLVWAF